MMSLLLKVRKCYLVKKRMMSNGEAARKDKEREMHESDVKSMKIECRWRTKEDENANQKR